MRADLFTRLTQKIFCHRVNAPATSLFSQRAVTLIELVISIVVFSIVLLAVFCVILSNVQFMQIFRQEAALKEDNAHIVDRLKKIMMNSEHVEIESAELPVKARLKMYDRKNAHTGTVELNNTTLTYKNELDGAMETLSTNVGSLVLGNAQDSANMSNIRLLKVALTTSDPGNKTAVASCSIITSIACRLSPRIPVVYNATQDKKYYDIQSAINEASTETVDDIRCMGKVMTSSGMFDGLFPENVTIDKSITLRGGYDEDFNTQTFDSQNPRLGTPTIIDGLDQPLSVINITGGNVTIDGFVVTNGRGGIHISGTDTTISNNAIKGNPVWGGICASNATDAITITISNNTITGNSTLSNYGGGGIQASGKNIIISNNTIAGNSAVMDNGQGEGGGINAYSFPGTDSTITISNNIITGNISDVAGAGIYINSLLCSTTIISNNTITENKVLTAVEKVGPVGFGGGIAVDGSGTTTISNNTIAGNSVVVEDGSLDCVGGGICAWGALTLSISNNTITENSTSGSGAGIFVNAIGAANFTISSNVITKNSSKGYGAGICERGASPSYSGSSTTTISNNIIAENTFSTSGGGGIYAENLDSGSSLKVTISNNTIVRNNSSNSGAGIRAVGLATDTVKIINSLCHGNLQGSLPSNIFCDVLLTSTVTYSAIGGGYPGEGNIGDRPAYVKMNEGDYHLQVVSYNDNIIDGGKPNSAYDPEDPLNPGQALYPPARGTVTNDMGAYGGPGAGVIGFVMPDKDLETPNINEKVIGTY